MIAGWLAGKLSGIVIFFTACLSIILLPAMIVQTVRINGISVFGWYAVTGYKPMWEADERDLVTLRGNQKALSAGLMTCNASVDALKVAGDKVTVAAQLLVVKANQNAINLQSNIAAANAIKSSGEKCPVAESILMRAFQ